MLQRVFTQFLQLYSCKGEQKRGRESPNEPPQIFFNPLQQKIEQSKDLPSTYIHHVQETTKRTHKNKSEIAPNELIMVFRYLKN